MFRLADEIGDGHFTVQQLAARYRPDLEELKKLRPTSTPKTALRRLQEFLGEHVYGALIAEDELSPRIRTGRQTGGGVGCAV